MKSWDKQYYKAPFSNLKAAKDNNEYDYHPKSALYTPKERGSLYNARQYTGSTTPTKM